MAVGVFFPPALTRFRVGVRMRRLTPLFWPGKKTLHWVS